MQKKSMPRYKIIFSGPVGSGKTSAITSISDVPPTKKDIAVSSPPKNDKNAVALDYGLITLDDETQIHLYGTPEQKRFDFIWDLLTHRGLGLILLIDNTDPTALTKLEFFLKAFQGFIIPENLAIGVTKMDISPIPSIRFYQIALRGSGITVPIFEVDARSKKDISILIQALLHSIDPTI